MNCVFCHQPCKNLDTAKVWECQHCPNNVHRNATGAWIWIQKDGKDKYAAEWTIVDEKPDHFTLYEAKRQGWMPSVKIAGCGNRINPTNILDKLPTILSFQ